MSPFSTCAQHYSVAECPCANTGCLSGLPRKAFSITDFQHQPARHAMALPLLTPFIKAWEAMIMAKPESKTAKKAAQAEVDVAAILVPIDFSDCSLDAFRMAVSVARRYGAELLLVYVVDTRMLAAVERLGVPVTKGQMKTVRHRVRLSFRGLMESEKGVPMRRLILEGSPFTEIMRLARTEKVDMIVMGAYGGRTGEVEKIFFGSTAEKIVRASPCPVLCVPPTGKRSGAGIAAA
jgi:nucleotide-binding universal stress UspA family protein